MGTNGFSGGVSGLPGGGDDAKGPRLRVAPPDSPDVAAKFVDLVDVHADAVPIAAVAADLASFARFAPPKKKSKG